MKISILFIFFLLLLLFLPCITQKIYSVCKYYIYQTTTLVLGIFLFWFETVRGLRLANYCLETVSKDALHTRWTLPKLLFMYSGRGTYNQATTGLLNACATGCNEFASNQLWVSSSSPTVTWSWRLILCNGGHHCTSRYMYLLNLCSVIAPFFGGEYLWVTISFQQQFCLKVAVS